MCTPTPSNLAEWRLQRGSVRFNERASTDGAIHGAPPTDAAVGRRPGRGVFFPREDWQDNLAAARGIVYGAIGGAAMWLVAFLLWARG